MHLRTVLLSVLLIAVVSPGAQAMASANRAKLRATVTLLPGSTLTATVPEVPVRPAGPEHAARSSPLTGSLNAKATKGLSSGADLIDVPFRGSIGLASFAPDPLCPSAAAPTRFEIVAPSRMTLANTGTVTWGLVVKGTGAQLFGCAPSGSFTGTTTLLLRGHTEANSLKRIALRGEVSDLALADGAKARLAVALVVNVNLRHRA